MCTTAEAVGFRLNPSIAAWPCGYGLSWFVRALPWLLRYARHWPEQLYCSVLPVLCRVLCMLLLCHRVEALFFFLSGMFCGMSREEGEAKEATRAPENPNTGVPMLTSFLSTAMGLCSAR